MAPKVENSTATMTQAKWLERKWLRIFDPGRQASSIRDEDTSIGQYKNVPINTQQDRFEATEISKDITTSRFTG